MKKIPTFSFTVFIVLIISLIIVFINSDDTFGQTFIEQIRVADSDDTLDTLSDEKLVSLGKAVCQSSAEWKDENNSLIVINNIVSDFDINTSVDDRILPILRFQSSYELCPEYVERLESLFIDE